MLKTGILNPQINSLLARVRHTNTVVIADRGFPFWPEIETVDIALIDDVPTVLEVLEAVLPNFVVGSSWMATEFREHNASEVIERYTAGLSGLQFEAHAELKKRVPRAVGLIRTGDTTQYSNVILQSA